MFLFVLGGRTWGAETPSPLSISLDAAVRLAEEKNPMLAAARSESAAAAARLDMARSIRRPSLSATSFFTNSDMTGVLSGPASVMPTALSPFPEKRSYDQNFMFMMPVDLWGRLSRNIRSADFRKAAASRSAERVRQDTTLSVRTMYYDVLLADENISTFDDALAAAQEQLKNDQAAFDAGKVPAYYLDRDRSETAMSEQALEEAKRDAAKARFQLAAMIGLDPSTPLQLTDELNVPPNASDVTEEGSPDLASARMDAAASVAARDAARRAYAPDVSISLMSDRVATRDMDTMNGTMAALVVSFPLWDGGMRRATLKETQAMRDAAAGELRNRELRVRADLLSARLDFETAMKNISTADAALKSAEETYRVVKLRVDAGKGIQVELLDALAARNRARVNRLQALRDALVARDTLLRVAGKL